MAKILPEIAEHVAAIGVPPVLAPKDLKDRGAVFLSPADFLERGQEALGGATMIIGYLPDPASGEPETISSSEKRQITALAGKLGVPCSFTPLLPSVFSFLDSRLLGSVAAGKSERFTLKDYVESLAPEGFDWDVKVNGYRIRDQAELDSKVATNPEIRAALATLGFQEVATQLSRIRDARRQQAGLRKFNSSHEKVSKKQITRSDLHRAPDFALPPDLVDMSRRINVTSLDTYALRLYRSDLGCTDESLARVIHRCATENGFPYAQIDAVYNIIKRARQRSDAKQAAEAAAEALARQTEDSETKA